MVARRGFSKFQITFMAVPVLAVASLHLFPSAMLWVTWARGQAGECPFHLVRGLAERVELQNETTKSIGVRSTILEPDESGLALWKTPYGDFWAPPATPVHYLLSEQLLRFYGDGPRRVQPGDVVLDCGANVGTFVWEALAAGASKVVAIEPAETNIAALRRNFAKQIDSGQVVVYPKGVWNSETVLKFKSYSNSSLDTAVMASREESGEEPVIVSLPVTTVDKIVAELGLERVHFIKMDVEGAELEALKGAHDTIGKHLPAIAMATENLESDQYNLPAWIMQEFPDYQRDCGWCSVQANNEIRADVFYFYSD